MDASLSAPMTTLHIYGDEAAANPWPLLQEIRELGPVVWHELYKRWMITTDQAVRSVVSDYRRFTVEDTMISDLFGDEAFISMDAKPRHDELRLVWAESFRKPAVERLRPTITDVVDRLLEPVLERLREGEDAEVSSAVCRALPTIVIALLMGLPESRLPDIIRWTDDMAEGNVGGATDLVDPGEFLRRREAAKASMADLLTEQLVRRRKIPSDDLISTLAHSAPGRRLPDAALMQNLRQLLFGGNETTAKWLCNITVILAERPELRRELAHDRSLIPAANDEIMRWQGVVGLGPRKVRGDVQLCGVELRDGDELDCLLTAANRDPARYVDPDRLDIHRPPQPNLGFGVGLHHCLGINLAKLEAEVFVNRLLDATTSFSIAAPYAYTTIPMRGPLPVVIGKEA
jgi:cytochrome P450